MKHKMQHCIYFLNIYFRKQQQLNYSKYSILVPFYFKYIQLAQINLKYLN